MEFFKVVDAIGNRECPAFIPEDYAYIFDSTDCDFCGAPLVINETRSVVECANPNCTRKLALSVLKIIQGLGIKGLGPKSIANYITDNNKAMEEHDARIAAGGTEYEPMISMSARVGRGMPAAWIKTRLDFLSHPPYLFQEEIQEAISHPMTYAEAVVLLHIPDMIERARPLFGDCDSYEEFMTKVARYNGMTNYIRTELIKGKNATTPQLLVNRVLQNVSDLRRIPSVFNIIPAKLHETPVYITGNVLMAKGDGGQGLSRTQFVQLLNNKLIARNRRLILKRTMSQQIEILVSDAQDTEHYRQAVAINKRRELDGGRVPPILICNSAELAAAATNEEDTPRNESSPAETNSFE